MGLFRERPNGRRNHPSAGIRQSARTGWIRGIRGIGIPSGAGEMGSMVRSGGTRSRIRRAQPMLVVVQVVLLLFTMVAPVGTIAVDASPSPTDSAAPSADPSSNPSVQPSVEPSAEPSADPSVAPDPTPAPTDAPPTAAPDPTPSDAPSPSSDAPSPSSDAPSPSDVP